MERAHDLARNPKHLVSIRQPKKIFLQNELNQKNKTTKNKSHSSKALDDSKEKLFNTDSLDDAMKELLDICQLYTDKLSTTTISASSETQTIQNKTREDDNCNRSRDTSPYEMKSNKQEEIPYKQTSTECDNHNRHKQDNHPSNAQCPISQASFTDWASSKHGSIERLQQKQSELQTKLDEVLQVAKALESKRQHKLKCILEDVDQDDTSGPKRLGQQNVGDESDEEEDELIEFQQIENELRISDLNRQLDVIQEELRLRLYKRLLSNANNISSKPQQNLRNVNNLARRGSSHTEESSPSSSSCSDETNTTASSSIADSMNALSGGIRPTTDKTNNHAHNRVDVTGSRNLHFETESKSQSMLTNNKQQLLFKKSQKSEELTLISGSDDSIKSQPNADIHSDTAVDNILGSDSLTIMGKEPLGFLKRSPKCEIPHTCSSTMPTILGNNGHFCPISSHRNSSTNSDLERIEEAEEDSHDDAAEHFRTIYEEKLSPLLQGRVAPTNAAGGLDNLGSIYQQQGQQLGTTFQTIQDNSIETCRQQEQQCSHYNLPDTTSNGCNESKSSFNVAPARFSGVGAVEGVGNSSSGSCSRLGKKTTTSRPLTLYLPKPDEEIDLVDHIQALGHDLNIISSDLKLSMTSASGYLWKCCSNNSKKWLKRYFYFDRNSKELSYYENEGYLVKRQSAPRNRIKFEEICDVYVDHKLSGFGEKNHHRSTKGKNFVFVLVTISRKYILSSMRAETMRAWIDILFTAAKANDYFQQLAVEEDEEILEEDVNADDSNYYDSCRPAAALG